MMGGRKRYGNPSPSSLSKSSCSVLQREYLIVAIAGGRGRARGEIGLAALNLESLGLGIQLSQFTDTATFPKLRTRLAVLGAREIVVPDAALDHDGNMQDLVNAVRDHVHGIKVETVRRRHFHEGRGLEQIRRLSSDSAELIVKDVEKKYYCLAAFAAVLSHTTTLRNCAFQPRSLYISYCSVDNACLIDPKTAAFLELMREADGGWKRSLFSLLNKTTTQGGARLLRGALLQPPTDADEIRRRHSSLEELLERAPEALVVADLVHRLSDVETMAAMWAWNEVDRRSRPYAVRLLNHLMRLYRTLQLLRPLKDALERFTAPTFRQAAIALEDEGLMALFRCLDSLFGIHDDGDDPDESFSSIIAAHSVNRVTVSEKESGALGTLQSQIAALRPGLNKEMDYGRRSYVDIIRNIEEAVVATQKQSMGLQVRCIYTAARGFHLQTYNPKENHKSRKKRWLPSFFLGVVYGKNSIAFTTQALLILNDKLEVSVNEILLAGNEYVLDMMDVMREDVGALSQLSEVVASLDFLISAFKYSYLTPTVRPDFTGKLALRQARHPTMETLEGHKFVPNDIFCSPEANLVMITGPNMGGKSTVLKTVAVVCVMAQAGFFVPAEYASLPVFCHIFSRISPNDDLDSQRSAFALEMNDMAYIIEMACPASLVIVDELCRSTAAEEGHGISHAICEFFLNHQRAFVFFATHFLGLTHMDALYSSVLNVHVGRDHRVHPGPFRGPAYGFELAAVASMPAGVLERAVEIGDEVRLDAQRRLMDVDASLPSRLASHRTAFQLFDLATLGRLQDPPMRNAIRKLKEQLIRELRAADAQ